MPRPAGLGVAGERSKKGFIIINLILAYAATFVVSWVNFPVPLLCEWSDHLLYDHTGCHLDHQHWR